MTRGYDMPPADEAVQAALAAVRWNADGLVCVVTCDVANNEVVMQAWMNREAFVRTLETGLATYWSRSRKELWIKGATSGETQKVARVALDCDGDCVLLHVELQGRGASCHTGRRSCFFQVWDGRVWQATGEVLFDPNKVYGK